MMPFWVRVVIGVVLGLAALVALSLTVGVTWITATAAALLAPIGFLGSFFLWTADRPDQGYEQVLFDRPNTLISAGMIVVFALAGVATGFVGGAGVGGAGPRDVAAIAQEYDATSKGLDAGTIDAATATAALDGLHAELEGREGPASVALLRAVDALRECIAAGATLCDAASSAYLDYVVEARLGGA